MLQQVEMREEQLGNVGCGCSTASGWPMNWKAPSPSRFRMKTESTSVAVDQEPVTAGCIQSEERRAEQTHVFGRPLSVLLEHRVHSFPTEHLDMSRAKWAPMLENG